MYRMVDCGTWDDPWFESLEPQGKLFFLYLLTNPRSTSCGAFEITPRKMAFETGIPQAQIEGWLASWAPRVQWWPEHQIVFLKNFYKRQTNSEKVRVNAARLVAVMPAEVRKAIYKVYPEFQPAEDRVSIPDEYPTDKQDRDVTETKTEQDGDETPPLPPQGEQVAHPPAKLDQPDQPYGMWQAFCEAAEYDIGAATAHEKGRSLATAKRLIEGEIETWEVVACTGYLRSQTWRNDVLSMGLVEKEIGKWRMAGRPKQERARAPTGPRRATAQDFFDMAAGLAKQEQR